MQVMRNATDDNGHEFFSPFFDKEVQDLHHFKAQRHGVPTSLQMMFEIIVEVNNVAYHIMPQITIPRTDELRTFNWVTPVLVTCVMSHLGVFITINGTQEIHTCSVCAATRD